MSDEQVSRRTFLTSGAALGAGVVVSGAALAKKKGDENNSVAFPFSEYKELKSVGGSAEGQMPDGMPVIVARVEEDKFVCVSIKCTHQNCDLLYDKKKKLFQCPCHNSAFDLEGQPVGGPARRALKVYAAEAAVVVRSDD